MREFALVEAVLTASGSEMSLTALAVFGMNWCGKTQTYEKMIQRFSERLLIECVNASDSASRP